MIDISLDVSGVVDGIAKVQERIKRNVPDALGMGAEMVAAQAKAVHDYEDRTSVLTNSIANDGVQGSFGGDLHATVSAGAEHGIYVEKGTKAHTIKPKHRKALRFAVEGGFAFSKGVDHPGTKATNFLANALEAKLPEVRQGLQDAVGASFAEAGFEVD